MVTETTVSSSASRKHQRSHKDEVQNPNKHSRFNLMPTNPEWQGLEDTNIEHALGSFIGQSEPWLKDEHLEVLLDAYHELKSLDKANSHVIKRLRMLKQRKKALESAQKQTSVQLQHMKDSHDAIQSTLSDVLLSRDVLTAENEGLGRLINHLENKYDSDVTILKLERNSLQTEMNELVTAERDLRRELESKDDALQYKDLVILDLETRLTLLHNSKDAATNATLIQTSGSLQDMSAPDLLREYLFPGGESYLYQPPLGSNHFGTFTAKELYMLARVCQDKEYGGIDPFRKLLNRFHINVLLECAVHSGYNDTYDVLFKIGLTLTEILPFGKCRLFVFHSM